MSTKSSLFLTEDNEHCYTDGNEPNYNNNNEWIGDTITLEIAKKNINIVCNDDEDLIIEIKPNCELYKHIMKMKE